MSSFSKNTIIVRVQSDYVDYFTCFTRQFSLWKVKRCFIFFCGNKLQTDWIKSCGTNKLGFICSGAKTIRNLENQTTKLNRSECANDKTLETILQNDRVTLKREIINSHVRVYVPVSWRFRLRVCESNDDNSRVYRM